MSHTAEQLSLTDIPAPPQFAPHQTWTSFTAPTAPDWTSSTTRR